MPSTLSLIRTMFEDARQRTTAISLWMMSFMVGGSIGPLVGGALLENFWWGSVFMVGVPVMVLLVVAGPFLLPEYRDPDAGRFDLVSAVLLLGTVLPVIYGIKMIAEDGVSGRLLAAIAVGVTVGVLFVRRQRALPDPLIDVRLFRNRGFGASLGVMTISTFAMMGLNLFVMQYLQLVHGLSPFGAGLWVLPMTGGMMLGMMTAPALAGRVRPAYLIASGMTVSAVGIGLMAQVGNADDFTLLITGTVLMAAGLAPAAALGTDLVISSAPAEKAGAASAASETSNEFGGALGLAVLGSVGVAVYRSRMEIDMPGGLPPEAAEAARDTLAGATAVAEQSPGALGAELLEVGRQAFTEGLQMTAIISASVVAVGAVLAAVLLRNVRGSSGAATTVTPSDETADAPAGVVAEGVIT